MKRTRTFSLIIAAALILASYGFVQAHDNYGRAWGSMGRQMAGNWGHMGGYGHMQDYGAYLESSCWSTTPDSYSGEITEKKARDMIAWHLTRTNDRLTVDSAVETADGFEVRIVTRKGKALVDKLLVEKDTGRIYRVYE